MDAVVMLLWVAWLWFVTWAAWKVVAMARVIELERGRIADVRLGQRTLARQLHRMAVWNGDLEVADRVRELFPDDFEDVGT